MSDRRVVVVWLVLWGCFCRTASGDEAGAIRQSAEAFAEAFNRGDAKAVAAFWTENGELVDEAGKTHQGRAAIEAEYAEFFKAHPGAKIRISPGSIRMIDDSTALESGTASLESPLTGAASYTAVHTKQNGQWLMATVRESSAAAESLPDLDWLVGTWTGEEHGAKSEITYSWLPDKKYLKREFTVTAPDGKATSGLQIIGVNPRTGQIVSWGFISDGGHTIGAWRPSPGGWTIEAAGMLPDGVATYAVNTLTKLDDNGYSWRSERRSVGGQSRPDTDEVILKRAETKQK